MLGFGTWTAFGAGKVLVGLDSADTLFDTLEETGGSKNAVVVGHTHTATSVVTDPGHLHTIVGGINLSTNDGLQYVSGSAGTVTSSSSATTDITVATTNSTEGVSATNANVQPFIVVKMWKRTA